MSKCTYEGGKAVSDFDPAECDYDNWLKNFGEAREQCPVFWSEAHGGYWTVSTYDDVTRVSRDWETFSSAKIWDPETGYHAGGNVVPSFPGPAFIPVESDPPEWKRYRFLLNPFFAPKAAESYRPAAEKMATALIDRVIEKGSFDIVLDLSNPLPALVTLQILGLSFDANNWERYSVPFHKLAYARDEPDFDQVLADLDWIRGQFAAQVDANRANPGKSLFNTLCHAEPKGGPLSKQELIDLGMMILVGGVGTTTALFSNTMIYLHKNRAARQQLIDNPDLLPKAREEFVRYFTPVHGQARRVMQDVEVNGQKMKKGDPVLLPFSSANRDEKTFENASEIILDRMPNPHVGFGSGIHRCLGSFLARVFFDAMFTEMIRRMPDYSVDLDKAERYPNVASVNGWINVPATFTPGPKVGTDIAL